MHIPTLDAHCDTIILREVRDEPMDFADATDRYHVDLPGMKAGSLAATFVMVGDNRLVQSIKLIDAVHQICETQPSQFALCRTQSDLRAAVDAGQVALFMSVEGQAMFADEIAGTRNWARLGVTMFSLTHGEGRFPGAAGSTALQYDGAVFGYLTPVQRANHFRQTKGLTPFAREAIAEIGKRGLILDLAHATDRSFDEALEIVTGPVCVSHGCTYSVCPHARNLTDDQMKRLASRGGVLGICFWGPFLDVDPKAATIDRVCDHVLHAIDIMGEAHVGVGTDFDGVNLTDMCAVETAGDFPKLWEQLATRGVSEAVIRRIAMDNFAALLQP